MTTQPQPEALRLADQLKAQVELGGGDLEELAQAAAELRRLHAECEELRAALAGFHYHLKFGRGLLPETIVSECETVIPALAAIDAARAAKEQE